MTNEEFYPEFERLTRHFKIDESQRGDICMDWFRALSGYRVDIVRSAFDQVILETADTYWPALGKIKNIITSRTSRYDYQKSGCATCHGEKWIDALPWKSNGLIYEGVIRCPDCGIPPPVLPPATYREELSFAEHAEWAAKRSSETPTSWADVQRMIQSCKEKLFAKHRMPQVQPQREPGEEG